MRTGSIGGGDILSNQRIFFDSGSCRMGEVSSLIPITEHNFILGFLFFFIFFGSVFVKMFVMIPCAG